jgi:outer membrane autotransporter protein
MRTIRWIRTTLSALMLVFCGTAAISRAAPPEEPFAGNWMIEWFADGSEEFTAHQATRFDLEMMPHETGTVMLANNRGNPFLRRTWFRSYGNWTNQQPKHSLPGFHADTFGIAGGIDKILGRHFLIGWELGGSWTDVEAKYGGTTKSVDAIETNLYSSLFFKHFYFDVAFGYDHNDYTILRNPGAYTARGTYPGEQWTATTELGLNWGFGRSELEPYFRYQHIGLNEKGFSETILSGSGTAQTFGDRATDRSTSMLGLRYTWNFRCPIGQLTPQMNLGWVHEYQDTDLYSVSHMMRSPASYTFLHHHMPRNRAYIGAGLTASFRYHLDIYCDYASEFATDYGSHTLLGGVNWNY